MLLIYPIFILLIVGIFMLKWYINLTRYYCENINEFYKRLCIGKNSLMFLDVLNNIRSCQQQGIIVNKLNAENEYWDDENRIKLSSDCSVFNRPLADKTSILHYRICIPYKKPITIECPQYLAFDEFTNECIYKNMCFGKDQNDRVNFKIDDFKYSRLTTKVNFGIRDENLYFVCDGRNKISKVESCPKGQIFNNVMQLCVNEKMSSNKNIISNISYLFV